MNIEDILSRPVGEEGKDKELASYSDIVLNRVSGKA
jgi:hypothetical protein